MTLPARFQVGAPQHVLAESVDEELLVVNLLSGAYYSAIGAGDAAFLLLASGHTLAETAEQIARHFQVDADGLAEEVSTFAARCFEDGLLIAREPGSEPEPLTLGHARPYTPIELLKYTDMEDLLAADPVHDVDAAGWPTLRRE